MTDVLVIAHFVGLALVAAGGIGAVVVMSYPGALPTKRGGGLKGIGQVLTRIMLFGLVLMWPSGIALLIVEDGVAAAMVDPMFWMKMGFAGFLTFAAFAIEFTYGRVRAGNKREGATLLSLGPAASLCFLMAIVFSVLAFR
jgi:hypothetical protein